MAAFKDKTGKVFGRLTVISRAHTNANGKLYWNTKCACGKTKVVSSDNLGYGFTRSCGCLRSELCRARAGSMSGKQKFPLAGKRFNSWTVLEHVGKSFYKCRCDCGTERVISGYSVKSGWSKSCGCRSRFGSKWITLTERRRKQAVLNARSKLIHDVFVSLRNRAKRFRRAFEFSEEQFAYIISQPCYYCGKQSSNIATHPRVDFVLHYTGLDRLDNSKGYTIANSVPCCKKCNVCKGTTRLDEFLDWIKAVYWKSCVQKQSES